MMLFNEQFLNDLPLFSVFAFVGGVLILAWNFAQSMLAEMKQISERVEKTLPQPGVFETFLQSGKVVIQSKAKEMEAELSPQTDSELNQDLTRTVAGLSNAEIGRIVEQNKQVAAMLLSMMPVERAGQILDSLPRDEFLAMTRTSFAVFDKNHGDHLNLLKETIRSAKQEQKKSSLFIERAVELIPAMGPAKEFALFEELAKNAGTQLVLQTAKKFIPSELVFSAPASVLRALFEKLSEARQLALLVTLTAERRNILLNALGEPGDKLRDWVDYELNLLKYQPAKVAFLQKDAEVYLGDFVKAFRDYSRANPAVARSMNQSIERWTQSLMTQSRP